MSKRKLVLGALVAILFATAIVEAGKCPYTGAPLPKPYSEVTILPVEKYVGEDLTITIIDVDEDGTKEPAWDRLVIIYYLVGDEVVSEYSIYTNDQGKAVFTPEDSGRIGVATSAKYIFFNVLSRCGDDRCSSDEDRFNCAEDCSTCGDGVCDEIETKKNCPKDCIICGDGSCDSGENRNNCAEDCAKCGDGVCDRNENKVICPEDCVVCGDGVCDSLEIASLHVTTCPEDCTFCGDGYCDLPEDYDNCPLDCAVCGDGSCDFPEDVASCPEDCIIHLDNETNLTETENETVYYTVCGDGNCSEGENKSNCPDDCIICGDGVCDSLEITSLHETACMVDCTTCGDGYCDKGESEVCEEDCKEEVQGLFIGYFLIPLIIAVIIILFELTRHYATARHVEEVPKKKDLVKVPKMEHMEIESVLPYFLTFTICVIFGTVLLAVLNVSYENNLAIFDLASYLLGNGIIISLMVVFLAVGPGILARATYYMERGQALTLSLVFTLVGMIPGLFIFLNFEYVILMTGMLMGTFVATMTIKKEEKEFYVKKPFKVGADFTDRMLFIASIFVCVALFFQLSLSGDTGDKFAASIWQSEVTKGVVNDHFGIQHSQEEVKSNVVDPFLDTNKGGISGRLVFAIAVTLLVLAVLKLFITITKMFAGFFAWLFDKSGFV